MIDPEHNCWWTHKRLTEIGITSSAIVGAGVPLRVLLHAFTGKPLVWFSKSHGEYNDNTLLIAVDHDGAKDLEWFPHPSLSPIAEAGAADLGLNEYQLTEQVSSALGISFAGDEHEIPVGNVIRYAVAIHDRCFLSIQPVERDLLREIVHAVLQQHSFYLEEEIDWWLCWMMLPPWQKQKNRSKYGANPNEIVWKSCLHPGAPGHSFTGC